MNVLVDDASSDLANRYLYSLQYEDIRSIDYIFPILRLILRKKCEIVVLHKQPHIFSYLKSVKISFSIQQPFFFFCFDNNLVGYMKMA